MPTKPFSIRNRVFLFAIAVLLISSIGLVVVLQGYANRSADQAFDRLLAASALSIAGAVSIEDSRITAELPYASLAMLSSQQRVFYSVRDAQGRLVTGYGDLDVGMPLATSATPAFTDGQYHGDAVRIGTMGRLISANRQSGWVTIRVAETREARDDLAAEILRQGSAPLLVMAAITLTLLWFGIMRAFRPLRGIERELRRRSPEVLEPLASPAPREVTRLVEALNGFMHRLQAMLSMLNNLVADAAHQVRTPLASLRAQAEVALDETDPQRLRERLQRIHFNATKASQLVNQLLMDATITHRIGTRGSTLVGLADLISEVSRQIGTLDARRLRVSIAPRLRRARVQGDRVALREMLRNLVDNALRHAPDGDVEVSVHAAPDRRIILQVADRGPGIPDHETQRVLERFVRGADAQSTPGSGLGLAIVKAVVESHGGTLVLRNRPGGGLLACVNLAAVSSEGEGARLSAAGLCLAGLLALSAAGMPAPARAQNPDAQIVTTRYPAPQREMATLTVAGPTDTPVFGILARGFQRVHPGVALVYHELDGRALYERAVAGTLPPSDVLISSAEDLQLRLANDGYALRYDSAQTRRLPAWAIWRSEVFSFTFEPIVMVYNTDRYTAETAPHSRADLLRMLEQGGSRYARIGTYDIAASSVGHLLAVQDDMLSSNFWGLANALGRSGVQLVSNTRDILDRIERGELDLGYNVLGSYALAYRKPGSKLGIVVPNDYQLVLSRTALIPRQARHPELAGAFVDWLLSADGQGVVGREARLGALPELAEPGEGAEPVPLLAGQSPHTPGIVQPIALSPTLLVGLDQQRHGRFLQNWLRLMTDTPERHESAAGPGHASAAEKAPAPTTGR